MVTPYQDLTLPFGGVTLWMNSSHPGGVLDKNLFFAPPPAPFWGLEPPRSTPVPLGSTDICMVCV
jgi:hypothetical protein